MGNRLSKIVTRTGDAGVTGLAGDRRVQKFHPRIIAIGDVDELNSAIGVVLAEPVVDEDLRALLTGVQHTLFEVGGELAMPEYRNVDADTIEALDSSLEAMNAMLPPLAEFVLPRGTRAVATCHLARAVCRRAERSLWLLSDSEDIRPELPRYLNRLSDVLFVAARWLGKRADEEEVSWDHLRGKPPPVDPE